MFHGSRKSGDDDPAIHLVYSLFNSPTPEGFVKRLRALEEARSARIDEEQYQEWRSAIFTDLASPKSFGKAFGVFLYPLTLLALALTVTGYFAEIQALLFGAGFLTVVLLIAIALLAVLNARHRSLSYSDRLQIVDHLLIESVITQEKAHELRSQIRGGRIMNS